MKVIGKLKSIYYLSSFFILLFLIEITFSQEVFKFFEFAPRSQEKITISKNSLEGSFVPFNDFLSGFDLFINNPKVIDLDITILDKNNQVFWQKRVGIPIINGGWWGQQYFITLGDNYPINSGEEYKIFIKGNLNNSSIDIFVRNILEILQGTESYLFFPENLKNLKIDNKEINYTLKFALYENKETIPPIISNLRLEVINSQRAKVIFNSNEPIIYAFKYKSSLDSTTSTLEINYFENCPYQVRDCQITFDVLEGRDYNFLLEAYDYWQNKTEKEGNFQVLGISSESNQEKTSRDREGFYYQGQFPESKISTNNLKQSNQNSIDFSQNLKVVNQKSERKFTNDNKQNFFKNNPTSEKKETIFTEKYLEDNTKNQKKSMMIEKLNNKAKESISKKQPSTSSQDIKIDLLNFSKPSQKIFIVFIFLLVLILIFILRKFKR